MKPAQKPISKSTIEKAVNKTGQEREEETFKLPSVPVSKPKKKPENMATVEQNYLDLWMPMLKNNKLYLEGNKLDPTTGAYFEERWHTSRIMTRISERVVATKKGTRYVLEGGLRVRDSELAGSSPIPEFIVNNFAGGFPESWQTLVVSWAAWLERQKSTTNTSSRNAGILFNSTPMLATPSQQGPPSNMTLTSVSSLTGVEASRFLPANKTNVGGVSCIACPNCQTVLLPPSETPARAVPMTTIEEEREGAENVRRSAEERELTTGNNRGVRKSPRVLQKKVVERSQEKLSALIAGEKTKGREGSRSQDSPGKGSAGETSEKQVEHRSRSKNVRVNRNSMTFMDTTMTKNDVTKLRAANYPCTVKDQGVKNYACLFCDFRVRLFADLKEHISREHDRDAPGAAPTPKKPGRRSKSAETVRAEEEEENRRKTKGRRSISHAEGEEDMPACFKAVKIGSKTEYKCSTCGGIVANKSSIKGHCKSKKHLVAAASRGVKRKSEVRVSQSPLRKAARQQIAPTGPRKKVDNEPLPASGNQKKAIRSQEQTPASQSQEKHQHQGEDPRKASRSQEKTRGDTPKRTPGLKRFSCFVCDFSTDEETAFRSHLVHN